MTDPHSKDHAEPAIRVVDRRWWARQAEGTDEGSQPAAERGDPQKPTVVEDLQRQLAEQATQLQTFIAEHRRALEEFEQVKVRLRRDIGRDVERARRAVLVDFLEVLDNLDRAIKAASMTPESADSPHSLLRGVELVRDQFLAKLGALGVMRLETLGQPFDATLHEAVTTTLVTDAWKDGLVVAIVKEGYVIGDELLRPASVVVGQFEA